LRFVLDLAPLRSTDEVIGDEIAGRFLVAF
jgi:hypothetical protein